ncbi:hypothetical protein DSO57_1025115 [Entomophthora muscae]|uniref:Uncharacterized protein n=1 Tax=Entomophthora muscae TaxID=34485 RepID=A0ACC2UN37_9FUNG|nr:hypothetical protein DSO57_1025115 [Entomophthora muscae]
MSATNVQTSATKQIHTATMRKPTTTKLSPAVNVKMPATTKQTSTATARVPAVIKQIHAAITRKPATAKLLPAFNTQAPATTKKIVTSDKLLSTMIIKRPQLWESNPDAPRAASPQGQPPSHPQFLGFESESDSTLENLLKSDEPSLPTTMPQR